MIDQQITVEYFDQNETFKNMLPRSGRVVREVSIDDGGMEWFLVELNDPFDYQHTIAEPDVFEGMRITHLLIKSRWEGIAVGGEQPTSVFVLLVPDVSSLERANVSSDDFIHVCWGMAHTTTSNKSAA